MGYRYHLTPMPLTPMAYALKKHSDGTVNEGNGHRQLTPNEKDVEKRKSQGELYPEVEKKSSVDTKVGKDKIFTKETFDAPSGRTYNFYGQDIDLDLKFEKKNPITGKVTEYTNREWMKKGRNPYVKDKNGKAVPTNQHHSKKNANGPIFELKDSTHKNSTNQKALHPDNGKKHPYQPVDRKEWDKDRYNINVERLKRLESEGK